VPPLLQMAGHGEEVARAPTFTNGWAWGGGGTCPHFYEWLGMVALLGKQETDQNLLPITKALTRTTNCTCRAKKVEGHDKFFLQNFVPDICPFPPPTFTFVPAHSRHVPSAVFLLLIFLLCRMLRQLNCLLDLQCCPPCTL